MSPRLSFRFSSAAVALVVVSPVLLSTQQAGATSARIAGADSPAVPVCGLVGNRRVPAVTVAPTVLVPAKYAVRDWAFVGGETWVLDDSTVHMIGSDGVERRSVVVNEWRSDLEFVTTSAGDIYTTTLNTLEKRAADGTVLWSVPVDAEPYAIYSLGTGDAFRVGVVRRNKPGSVLYKADGTLAGTAPYEGEMLTDLGPAGVSATDTSYLRRWDANGNLALKVADGTPRHTPDIAGASFQFQQAGGAVVDDTGKTYVADGGRGIDVLDPHGLLVGVVPSTAIGGVSERSRVALRDGRLYWSTGARNAEGVSSLALSDVAAMTAPPARPALGLGAGLSTGTPYSYVMPGTSPHVTATFDPWWQSLAGSLVLRTSVRSSADSRAGRTGTTTEIPLSASVLASPIPIDVPAAPDAYEVDSRLLLQGEEVSATCLPVSVGAPGDTLDFSTLPAGGSSGGPGPARCAALADVLGTGLCRLSVRWSALLPTGASASVPIDFSSIDTQWRDAVKEAQARGVVLVAQLADGSPAERALISDGTWGTRVREFADHFKGVISYWEPYNEPNNSYGPAADYVTKVLAPFSDAIHASDPTNKVVGGSTLEVPLDYWKAIIDNGGLAYMDLASVHSYTGHNRSFEEIDEPAWYQGLHKLFADAGRPSMELWDTESALWSNGPYNRLVAADDMVRSWLIRRENGISRWSYFLPEGAYGDFGLSYSAIEYRSHVKPVALALMVARREVGQRPAPMGVETGIPGVTALRFGSTGGGHDVTYAVWAEGMSTRVAVDAPAAVAVSQEFGAQSTLKAGVNALAIGGDVTYLTVPAGSPLQLLPIETYGPDLALSSAGATVMASSSSPLHPAATAIDGSDVAAGGFSGVWGSAVGDSEPVLTITLASAPVLDRIVVGTSSLGSVLPGLRDYDLELESPDGVWATAATVRNEFFDRHEELSFAPQAVAAFRLRVRAVNYGGYSGGMRTPTWLMANEDANDVWFGPATVTEVAAYAPGTVTELSQALPATPTVTPTVTPIPRPTRRHTPQTSSLRASGTITIAAGQSVVSSARLLDAAGKAVSALPVQVYRRPHSGGAWQRLATVMSSRTGVVSVRLTPTANTEVIFTFAGNTRFKASRSIAQQLRVSRKVTTSSAALTAHRGRAVAVIGTVSPRASGSVVIQRRVGRVWKAVKSVSLSRSAYRANLSFTTRGTVLLRVIRQADTAHIASASWLVTVTVK